MIKYRVFDIIQNKYIDSKDVSIDGNGVLTVVGIEGKYHMSVQPPNGLAPRFIIEQYIGKDNNGVDIFAGDILRCTIRSIDEFVTCTIVVKEGLRCGDLSYCERFAVIGNIHDNGELLEESK